MSFTTTRARALALSLIQGRASKLLLSNKGLVFNTSKNYSTFNLSLRLSPSHFSKINYPSLSRHEIINFLNPNGPQKASFHSTSDPQARVKEKQTYSSLLKHKKPDGLTGAERRQKMIKESKNKRFVAKPVTKNTRGFTPTRFQLSPIPSDRKMASPNHSKLTYEVISARKKFNEREKNRLSKGKFREAGSAEARPITKFDMADLETLDNLKKRVNEARFEDMGLRPELLEAIYKLFPETPRDQIRPTEIQALAIPELLRENHSHVLCAAETGTGKTLSYLIPITNRLKEQEGSSGETLSSTPHKPKPRRNIDFGTDDKDPFLNGTVEPLESIKEEESEGNNILSTEELRLLTTTPFRKLNRPRALVLVPSCALADQVYAVAKVLSHTAKFRAVALTRKTVRKDLLRRLNSPIDLLVSTPASLERYISDGTLSISELQLMVVDEADTMFEKGFGEDVKSLIATMVKSCKNQKRDYQLAVVSATLPKLVLLTLESRFPDLVRITTPSLHKALPKCKQYFVDLKDYKGNRTLGLLDVLRQFEQRSTASPKKKESDRILIFCNTRKSVTIVQAFLRERKINCLSLYGGIPCTNQPPASPEQIHAFLYPSSDRVSANYDFAIPARVTTRSKVPVPTLEASEGEELADGAHPTDPAELTTLPKILICTDIASRGLDTTSVNHVIMYDFPVAALDYLHRCGRTARAGQSGVVTSLLGKKDRMLAERIRRSIRTNTVLS